MTVVVDCFMAHFVIASFNFACFAFRMPSSVFRKEFVAVVGLANSSYHSFMTSMPDYSIHLTGLSFTFFFDVFIINQL